MNTFRTWNPVQQTSSAYVDVFDPALITTVEAHNLDKRSKAKFVDTRFRYTPNPHWHLPINFLEQGENAKHEWGTS
ncbi:hypothetical protein KJ807_05675 [Patescibacteria group bacterium]|nr:hypothetical protein [Patescibacteria group bacterium]